MDFKSWWSSDANNFRSSLKHVKNGYERVVSLDIMVAGSRISRWRMLWRRLKKEKKKYFGCTASNIKQLGLLFRQGFSRRVNRLADGS
ncbi:hypothetical protein I3843_01G230800 [Carya illinoinensis]|uniref:Uncharacterized protein n=1 Tax=Carya illinoinensis TaxID=32201 RepID=A0A922G4D4_CARIL|nr:hypothetical protein I3842_01G240200 [Carya illinoinensis]KAG6733754.1 hypothetical protein I3842_01G240200 [Carya illinoinensis]KAG7997858.1 hypothetical protein I3843_01G230800 [Carya illinoinensis]